MSTDRTGILTAATIVLGLGLATGPALAGGCGSAKDAARPAAATAVTPGLFDLAGEAGFTTLTAAIEAAGLQDTLNQDGPFTVFAPTDEAFASLPEGTLEALLADKEKLTRVLLYHVASGEVSAEDVADLRAARTLNGEKVAIGIDPGVTINDASVVKADVKAQNGIIHVIDAVLIPSNL